MIFVMCIVFIHGVPHGTPWNSNVTKNQQFFKSCKIDSEVHQDLKYQVFQNNNYITQFKHKILNEIVFHLVYTNTSVVYIFTQSRKRKNSGKQGTHVAAMTARQPRCSVQGYMASRQSCRVNSETNRQDQGDKIAERSARDMQIRAAASTPAVQLD